VTGQQRIEGLLREFAPQVLAALVRRYGQFDACEDAVQEALLAATQQWPQEGLPDRPRAWLLTVASRRLTDHWRRDRGRRDREVAAVVREPAPITRIDPGDDRPSNEDDTLKLLYLCCHPSLSTSSQIALTLRAVGGLTTAEIARACLVPEGTMARRISRSKQRIKEAGVRFAMPPPGERAQRLQVVLHVLYLIFNEGYTASSGPQLLRAELTAEAIRIARTLHELLPGEGEVTGLLALMLLTDAHRESRAGPSGALIPLAEQDRTRWNRAAIKEGIELVTDALSRSPVGPYQLQAAIAAVHAEAKRAEDTDWPEILALYRLLSHISPNPMITLNQAVAVAMVDGPHAGLVLLSALERDQRLAGSHRLDAVRAHLLEMAGDHDAARHAYREAARRTTSLPEQRYLEGRAARLASIQPGGANMEATMTNTLKVPGATLYYEVQGSGPVLLLICGGVYDARTYAPLVQQLADRYTVVTYDRRGNSRSPFDGPPQQLSIDVHSDDAYRLLTNIGLEEPAYVFGNSSGAIVGLELAARHPARVRTVVAHEPPIFELLPDRDHWRTVIRDVEDTFAKKGAGPAMQVFNAGFGGGQETGDEAAEDGQQPPPELDPDTAAHLAEIGKAMEKNMEIFIGYEVPPVSRYTPDIAALQASSTRIVAAVGDASKGTPMYDATVALAERLGTEPVVFPGDHGGFSVQPDPFAAKLHEVLRHRKE
jgi:RNA polymerase sigma factor (sigma-70 family)